MGSINVKGLGEVEAWKGGAMMPLGYHTARIDEAEWGRNAADEHDVLELTFIGSEGSIRDWLHVTEGSLGKLAALLDACAISRSDDMDIDAAQFEGQTIRIFVAEEPDYGGATNPDGSPLMRRRVKAYEHTNADPQPDQRGLARTTTINDEDIPF